MSNYRSHNRGRRLGIRADPWYRTMFLFLEQIGPSWRHIFALTHARVVGSRVDVVTLHDQKWWELWDSLEDFSQRWQGIRQERKPGLFYALLCSELTEKVSLSGSKISSISRFEWIISARACCTRKLLRLLSKKTLHSGIELVSEFPKQYLIITQALFCRVSYCFCLFGEFAKVFL